MSSTILEFKMRCPECSNIIIVQTDPENTDYKYTEGARRIVTRLHKLLLFFIRNVNRQLNTEKAITDVQFIRDESEKAKIQEDAFYNLENKATDQKTAIKEKPRIQSIMKMQNVIAFFLVFFFSVLYKQLIIRIDLKTTLTITYCCARSLKQRKLKQTNVKRKRKNQRISLCPSLQQDKLTS